MAQSLTHGNHPPFPSQALALTNLTGDCHPRCDLCPYIKACRMSGCSRIYRTVQYSSRGSVQKLVHSRDREVTCGEKPSRFCRTSEIMTIHVCLNAHDDVDLSRWHNSTMRRDLFWHDRTRPAMLQAHRSHEVRWCSAQYHLSDGNAQSSPRQTKAHLLY